MSNKIEVVLKKSYQRVGVLINSNTQYLQSAFGPQITAFSLSYLTHLFFPLPVIFPPPPVGTTISTTGSGVVSRDGVH